MAHPFVTQGNPAEIVPWTLRLFATYKLQYKKPADVQYVDDFYLTGRSRYPTWLRPMGAVLVVPAGKFLMALGSTEIGTAPGSVGALVLGVLVKASTLTEPVPFISLPIVPKPVLPVIRAAEVP
jgi:hypothetical protein